jgi:hypothetical protein
MSQQLPSLTTYLGVTRLNRAKVYANGQGLTFDI